MEILVTMLGTSGAEGCMPKDFRIARQILFLLALGSAANAATTIWAGTQAGVWRSTDSGATWHEIPVSVSSPLLQGTDPQTPDAQAIALDPQQPATVYFVGHMKGSSGIGFFRSTDNGNTWTATVLIGISTEDPAVYQEGVDHPRGSRSDQRDLPGVAGGNRQEHGLRSHMVAAHPAQRCPRV